MTPERRLNRTMRKTAMRNAIVTVLAAALASGFATPAVALEEPVAVTVDFADLDVADPAGVSVLTHRIGAAIDKVCARPDMRNLKAMAAWEECREEALAGAMEQLALVAPYADVELASRF